MSAPSKAQVNSINANLLTDKVILITGASEGIGKEAALEFARQGAHVVLIARSQDKLEAIYDEIEATTDTRPTLFPYDLNTLNPDIALEMAQAIQQEYGRLDGVLFNASILGSKTTIADYPAQQWLDVINTNLNSCFYLTQALLPLLETADAGRIVFTSSGVGRKGRATWGAYAVSKFATEGLMQTLADEVKDSSSVKVFAVNPGGTRTQMRASAFPQEAPETLPSAKQHMPLYRYLMSEQSDHCHGLSLDAYDYL